MISYGFVEVHGCLSLDVEALGGFVMVGDDYKCVSALTATGPLTALQTLILKM